MGWNAFSVFAGGSRIRRARPQGLERALKLYDQDEDQSRGRFVHPCRQRASSFIASA